jgi:hypothetical protein
VSSNAYVRFSATIYRAWRMAILRHGLIENQVIIGDGAVSDYDDIGRVSIVLAVAAMDGYFTEAFIEKLVPFLKKKRPTKKLVQIFENAGFGIADALQLLNQFNPLARIKRTLENHLERYVTQSTERIDDLFLAYGYKNLSRSAEAKTKRKALLKTVTHIVTRRHQIVHDGDYYKNGKLRTFSQYTTNREVRALEAFVMACDEILFTDNE